MKLLRERVIIEQARTILEKRLGEDGEDAPEPGDLKVDGYVQRANTA